jgi:histone acetyltransferase (RNA polymerase elongator complex component)
VLYQVAQSIDENVLRNVKRQNIKLQASEQLQVLLRSRGMRSGSDMILGLPGEPAIVPGWHGKVDRYRRHTDV